MSKGKVKEVNTDKELYEKPKTDNNQKKIEEFILLASDLKEIVLSLNQRVSEVEGILNRIKNRMGL